MSTAATEITIRIDDEVLLRLNNGARPLECSSTTVRISYEIGVNVLHVGVVWAVGYYGPEETPAIELEDGTIVALGDIDPSSVAISPVPAAATE